jgi:hypothetical protein
MAENVRGDIRSVLELDVHFPYLTKMHIHTLSSGGFEEIIIDNYCDEKTYLKLFQFSDQSAYKYNIFKISYDEFIGLYSKFEEILKDAKVLPSTTCYAQVDDYFEYNNDIDLFEQGFSCPVWTTSHENGSEPKSTLHINYELIRSLPQEIKAIIARYTTFIPYLLDKEIKRNLAQALGSFRTLEEAQKALLKHGDSEEVVFRRVRPEVLSIQKNKHIFFRYHSLFDSFDERFDEFEIGEIGLLVHVRQLEHIEYIPYNKSVLDHKYYNYQIKLNGKEVEYLSVTIYLDPDNIESVGVNELEKIVDITQKNKNPDYFALSDLNNHLDSLKAFKVKNIKEIHLIELQEGAFRTTFYQSTKIEKSDIKAIYSYTFAVKKRTLKGVLIVLKNEKSK